MDRFQQTYSTWLQFVFAFATALLIVSCIYPQVISAEELSAQKASELLRDHVKRISRACKTEMHQNCTKDKGVVSITTQIEADDCRKQDALSAKECRDNLNTRLDYFRFQCLLQVRNQSQFSEVCQKELKSFRTLDKKSQ